MLLGAIVLVALVLRLAGLGDRLSADEGYSWLVASAPSFGAFLDRLVAYENTPPLYYLLLAPLPHGDEAWLRLPSLLASVATVPVLYAAALPLVGRRGALLGAFGLAVAPYAVSFADYSRGFALAGLGLAVGLWGVARLATGGGRRWWWVYAAGAVVALYAEYDTGLFLAALALSLAALGRVPRRETLLLGAAPALALVPWIPELSRSLDALDETKVSPTYPGPSPGSVRDVVAPLFFGEHGAAGSGGVRAVQALAVLAALGAAAWMLARARPRRSAALWILGGTLAGGVVLHGLVALVGPDVFAQRYLLSALVPAAALLGGAVALVPWRPAVPLAAAALAVLAVTVLVQRTGRELEPDPAAVRAAVARGGERTVLTNSAVQAFYLRDRRVVLDRPFGLGRGRGAACGERCTVVDDKRVAGGARSGPGTRTAIGPIVVRYAR